MSNWCEIFGLRLWELAVIAALAAGSTAAVATAQEAVDLEAGRPVLSLRECVLIAVRESPTLQTAAARRDITDQDVKIAWGAFLPDLTVGHNYSKADRTDSPPARIDNNTSSKLSRTYSSPVTATSAPQGLSGSVPKTSHGS